MKSHASYFENTVLSGSLSTENKKRKVIRITIRIVGNLKSTESKYRVTM